MHRLRTFRKGKEDDDSVPPMPQSSSSKGFKWGKSSSPVPKQQPELDLQHVLPPTDDFRISLLMPNLAQRFSILQMEQAAAAAAAAAGGKVNGDKSAIDTPAFKPLGEISETSSVTAQSWRLTTKSEESMGSSAETDGGSIMNRGRGGEGNVLFGGRQKVYRVPAATPRLDSSEDLAASPSTGAMNGRIMYENDLTDAAFAKPRKSSNERDSVVHMDGSGEYNRYTSSSTNSTPNTHARSSTAATSVNSNSNSTNLPLSASTPSLHSSPAAPVGPMVASKPRRPLYEQALDQQLQDHQNSSAGRLERLASIRKLGTTSPSPTFTTNGSFANGSRGSPQLGQGGQHVSPTSPVSHYNGQWSARKRPDSPLSPREEEGPENVDRRDPVVLPNLGTFNFGLDHQQQAPRMPISPPVSASGVDSPAQSRFQSDSLPKQKSQGGVASPPAVVRGRSSLDSMVERSLERNSKDTVDTQTLLSVRTTSSGSSYGDDRQLDSDIDGEDRRLSRISSRGETSFRPGISVTSSPVSEPVSPVSPVSPPFPTGESASSTQPPVVSEVPPFRNRPIPVPAARFSDVQSTSDSDSPTLPPPQGLGLLVRQHLRNDSSHSSVYAPSTYTRGSRYAPASGRSGENSVGKASNSSGTGTVRPSGASGSSGGNLWEFDDWEGPDYRAEDVGRSSPSAVSDSQGSMPPPSIPQKAPGRVSATDMRLEDKKAEDEWTREREREREMAASRADEIERKRLSEEEEDEKDWQQQLVFRKQVVEQNLKNHEKVLSQHEMAHSPQEPPEHPRNHGAAGFSILKSKSSNGFLAKNDAMSKSASGYLGRGDPTSRALRGMPMEPPHGPPPMRPDGRGRMIHDEERMLRGPHMSPPQHHHHPMHQPPPHHRQFQGQQSPLNASQPYGRHPLHGLPHPVHAPMHTPRIRPRQSQEQMNSPNGRPGVPMGWREDNWGTPRSPPGTQPGTPTTPGGGNGRMVRRQPSMPGMNGHRDDMPRGPMPGPMPGPMQGQHYRGREDDFRHSPPRRPQPRPQYDSDGGYDYVGEPHPHSSQPEFRRPRNNGSNDMPPPPGRRRQGTLDGTTIPPRGANADGVVAAPPTPKPQPSPAVSAFSTPPVDSKPFPQRTSPVASTGPAQSVVTSALASIQNSNAGFAPAKKRVVNKSQIGEPKLVSATSNIPTKALPPQDPTPPLTSGPLAPPGTNGRRRRMTTTQTIFSGFGKKSSEDVPAVPPQPAYSRHKSDDEVERSSFTDDPPRKKKGGAKLRKSTSDGGALAARSRQQAAAAMSRGPSVPKISKAMLAPEGMI